MLLREVVLLLLLLLREVVLLGESEEALIPLGEVVGVTCMHTCEISIP